MAVKLVPEQAAPRLIRGALVLVAVALALRLAALYIARGRQAYGDPGVYLELAHNLLSGQGLTAFNPAYGGIQKAFYPPLYPLLLAAVGSIVPLSQPTIFAVNFTIDLAAAWAIARLTSELGFKPLLAAAIYLLWPSNILFAPIPQKEGLVSLLVALAAWSAVRKSPIRLGVTAGLLALTQPALAPLPFIFALLLRTPVIGTAAMATLVMLPWWIRNYYAFDAFVPLTTGSGYGLWIGTFSNDGWWIVPPKRLVGGDELAFSRAAAHEARAWIFGHPARYLWHCAAKLARGIVNGWWSVDNLMRMRPVNTSVLRLLPYTMALTAALTALGIFGAVIVRGTIGKLLLACLLQIVLFNLWFEFSERHTYFTLPFLSLAAAAGIQHVLRDLRLKTPTEPQTPSAHPASSRQKQIG